jgi:hypothetical protein
MICQLYTLNNFTDYELLRWFVKKIIVKIVAFQAISFSNRRNNDQRNLKRNAVFCLYIFPFF